MIDAPPEGSVKREQVQNETHDGSLNLLNCFVPNFLGMVHESSCHEQFVKHKMGLQCVCFDLLLSLCVFHVLADILIKELLEAIQQVCNRRQ